ncbi:MAG TPA: ABC transporter permease subunit [Syntrophomonas sp.]|nr:ABC transporter permease subunit [Syntrophomonas sp.]
MGKGNAFFKFLLMLFAFSILVPIVIVAIWSLASRWPWPGLLPESLSLRGLDELFGSYSGAMQTLGSSILLSVTVAILAVIIGTMTARALVMYNFAGKQAVEFGAILPIIIPGTVFAMGVHVPLIRLGLADNVVGVILVHLICGLPYTIKIMTDISAAFGSRLEEQALLLGASPRQVAVDIILPSLLPGLITSGCMAYIISFSQYFLTLLIGGGHVKTFSLLMVPYLQSGDRTVASAYSMVFIVSTLLLFIVIDMLGRKFSRDGRGYLFM